MINDCFKCEKCIKEHEECIIRHLELFKDPRNIDAWRFFSLWPCECPHDKVHAIEYIFEHSDKCRFMINGPTGVALHNKVYDFFEQFTDEEIEHIKDHEIPIMLRGRYLKKNNIVYM